ncbi:IclR family transcriptional regulator [Aeromicrobium sp. 9AM]|uniref:IclR family transcriptional regulator n=1 Tax=Aeromicrobium sp. 9AM TaxID=2653126 RepID=UPI0012F2C4A3|nr:IclR family transcriptional regulator [Aeromicrobium sp. 9AM]VXB09097.1 conserved hypothetical protein [Aeromicrobium sp. 9AM]
MANTVNGREVRPVQALVHALEVLEALGEHRELGVSELSREIGLSKTAVYNILGTFESLRFVRRDPSSSRYKLGWRLNELGALVLSGNDLDPVVTRPLLQKLAIETGESVLLSVLDREGVTYIDRVESHRPIRMVAAPGRQSPLHATASGKVLLAYQPAEVIDSVLDGTLTRFTDSTITDPAKLRKQLAEIAANEFASVVRENEPDLSSVAVPIRDYSNEVIAALAIAAPADRLDSDSAREGVLSSLRDTAQEIESHLGVNHS